MFFFHELKLEKGLKTQKLKDEYKNFETHESLKLIFT